MFDFFFPFYPVGSGAYCIPAASSACALLHRSIFSLSFCLDLHVFNVNATKNHDPFLLIWFSFTIFRSLSRPVFFFRVAGFRQIPSSFYWRWQEIPHLNFLPCTTMTRPALAGEYGHILTWIAGPVFWGSLSI